jgi:rare lipoprotein A
MRRTVRHIVRAGMRRGVMWATVLSLTGCAGGSSLSDDVVIAREEGIASYYAHHFQGKPTASGEIYDETTLTAAHRDLPFGTRTRVTNLGNGRSVVVRINDRGPFIEGRVIDLSYAAAQELELIQRGLATVRVEVLGE